ncbi:121_t:CDS:2 [Ambispora gerdemannii]|uniref:121_t:CDS:1 n=1 Tax=Ambispora gerdemannii TaxID=144530 RepID=A0A9N9A022_9GLOM|nr:121_t:CDS:2 [Ambispora gerdemannii]
MRKRSSLVITLLLLYSSLLSTVSATKVKIEPFEHLSFLSQTYFVEYDKLVLPQISNFKVADFLDMDGQSISSLAQKFLGNIKLSGVNFKLRNSFDELLDAVTITVDSQDDLDKLNSMSIVKSIQPVSVVNRPKILVNDNINDSQVSPSLFYTDKLTGVAEVQAKTKYRGKNIKVGIIDTGIDYTHPAFGNCYKTKGCKIQYGYDFVGDAFNGTNAPQSDDDPLDQCSGHGTHVAGILAADDKVKNFTGVAPGVTLGIYRIFGCNGTSANDLVIKAMERAYKDGMDIINLSLGASGGGWAERPAAAAAEKLIAKGVVIVAAIGNDGDQGIFQTQAPGVALSAISVSAVENSKFASYYLTISSASDKKIEYSTQNLTRFNISGNPEIVATSDSINVTEDACKAQPANSLTGKIALIRRGGCPFTQKLANAQTAGAVGIIFYDNVISVLFPPVVDAKIPAALIRAESGEFIFNQIKKNKNVTVTFSKETFPFANPKAGKISSFSSFGPSNELDIKPEIAAPGGEIFSTYPVKLGSYKTISGTSMASPYFAGCVAILFEAKGKLNASETKKLFMNTAHPIQIFNATSQTRPQTSINKQGAGLVNLLDALSSTISISPPKLSLNDTANHKARNTIKIKNSGKNTVKLTVTHVGAQAINGYNFSQSFVPQQQPIFQNSFAKVNISESSIELRPGQLKSIKVTIKPPPDLDNDAYFLYSGLILFTDKANNKSYSVPYMGMKGIYKTLPILDTSVGTPFIQTKDADIYTDRKQNVTFTLQKDDDPILVVRLGQGTRILSVDVVPADTKIQSNVGGLNSSISSLPPSTPASSTELSPHDVQIGADVVPGSLGKISICGVSYYVARNQQTGPKRATPIIWNGKVDTVDGKRNVEVPNGSYRLVVLALKLYGDEKSKNDWEIWVSPRLDIQRP